MKTVFLAIPFGVAVRDVLRSEAVDVLTGREDTLVVVLVPEKELPRIEEEFRGPRISFEALYDYHTSAIERLLYHLNRGVLFHKCHTVQLGNVGGMTWALRVAAIVAKAAICIVGQKNVMRSMAWAFRHLTPQRMYSDLFAAYRPDVVVVSRVLNFSRDYPVMKRAQVEKVPVVVLVSSWDNLTSKGFFAFDAHRLVVWNEVMKEEAVSLFHYPPSRVVVSGIPRYDIFFKKGVRRARGAFFEAMGLDIDKKLITYATASATTGLSPQDKTSPEPEIVGFIADAIAMGRLGHAQLLVRLHPQAKPDQYANIGKRGDVVIQTPGIASGFGDRLFSREEDEVFAETMLYSDVVVNMGSTVTLDAIACETPVVCVGFDFRGPRPYLESVRRYYDFDHYKKLGAMGCYRLAESRDALLEMIARYLEDSTQDAAARRSAVLRYCSFTDGASGERVGRSILEVLNDISGTANTAS